VLPIPSAFDGRRVVSMNALIWRYRVNCPAIPHSAYGADRHSLSLAGISSRGSAREGSSVVPYCRPGVCPKLTGIVSRADTLCYMLLPGISGQAPMETEVYASVENRALSEEPLVTKVISGFGEASANIVTTESFVTSRF